MAAASDAGSSGAPPTSAAVSARARRSLAAARAARDGIASMVEGLKIGRAPRPPLPPLAARRAALMGGEIGDREDGGREEGGRGSLSGSPVGGSLFGEDGVRVVRVPGGEEGEVGRLKMQWAKALVRRRQVERERDLMAGEVRRARAAAVAAGAGRRRLVGVVLDFKEPLKAMGEAGEVEECRALAEEMGELVRVAEEEMEKQRVADLREAGGEAGKGEAGERGAGGGGGGVPPRSRQVSQVSGGAGGARWPSFFSDDVDETRSFVSLGSSTAFGDDQEAALQALADVADVLESRLAGAAMRRGGDLVPAGRAAADSLARARRTLADAADARVESMEVAVPMENSGVGRRSDREERMLEGGTDEGEGAAADANEVQMLLAAENAELRDRLKRLEDVASRASVHAETLRRNSELQAQLVGAKKAIGRLVQERNSSRRSTMFANGATPSSVRTSSRTAPMGDVGVGGNAVNVGDGGAGGTDLNNVGDDVGAVGDSGGAAVVGAGGGGSGRGFGREISRADTETIRRVLDWRSNASAANRGVGSRGSSGVSADVRGVGVNVVKKRRFGEEGTITSSAGANGVGSGVLSTSGAQVVEALNAGDVRVDIVENPSASGGIRHVSVERQGGAIMSRPASSRGRESPSPSPSPSRSPGRLSSRAEGVGAAAQSFGGDFRSSVANSEAGDEVHVTRNIFVNPDSAGNGGAAPAAGGLLGLL